MHRLHEVPAPRTLTSMSGLATLTVQIGEAEVRVIAADASAMTLAAVSVSLETLSPHPGWAEQRPDDWWAALREALAALGGEVALTEVGEVRLDSTIYASVFLDGELEVIRPAILAGDQRASAEAAEIERSLGHSLEGPAASHLLWMRRNQAIAFKRVRRLLSPKGYLRFLLTGDLAFDAGDAAATGLFDASSGDWSEATCDALEISMEILPPVRAVPRPMALLEHAAAALGLMPGIPVIG